MKRSLGGFLIIVGIILSTYAFSVYNLYTATNLTKDIDNQSLNFAFYLFFALAAICVIAGVTLISVHEKSTE